MVIKNLLDKKAKEMIVEAIRRAEKQTSGEIRVHVTKNTPTDILEAAKKTFHKLGMHRTRHRNGVLIFISWKKHELAILGDRGIHEHVGDSFWAGTRDKMIQYFSEGRLPEGIVAGVLEAGEKLKEFFPLEKKDKNEISNNVTVS